MAAVFVCAIMTALVLPVAAAEGDGFLSGPSRGAVDREAADAELQAAMDGVMGCGNGDSRDRLPAIERALLPIWRALPKNQHGKVEWRMLRYLAHRHFMQQSSLLIRGFEPSRQVNESHMGTAEILSKQVPSLVSKLSESRQATDGFTLEDAVAMVATLERVIFNSETTLLDVVYRQQKQSPQKRLAHADLFQLMEAYMVHWMMGDDSQGIRILMKNRTLLETAFPHWQDVSNFAKGMVRSMEFSQQHDPQPGHGSAALARTYSFEEVHEVVGGITTTFASYWEAECQVIKTSLVEMDKTGTGRVSLADFYGANSDGEWRFGESEAYLRELGALDETSSWRGKQVIITNYLLGASNCIVTTPHYLVCCVNECESVLNEIEDNIGAPLALPEEVLPLVANMSDFNDEKPKMDAALQGQLRRIAEAHGGKVPLHGRLFSQWLHYVFPRECPFPHKAGAVTSLTPVEFGDQYVASESEVNTHASKRGVESDGGIAQNEAIELQRMSQWSEEEELHADYTLHMRAPWEASHGLAAASVFAAILALAALYSKHGGKAPVSKTCGTGGAFDTRAHFV